MLRHAVWECFQITKNSNITALFIDDILTLPVQSCKWKWVSGIWCFPPSVPSRNFTLINSDGKQTGKEIWYFLISLLSLLSGDFSFSSGGSGGRVAAGGSEGMSSSVLIKSSSSHRCGFGAGNERITTVGTSSAQSSGERSGASGAAVASGRGERSKEAGGGSSSMSYSFGSGSRETKKEGGLGAVTVSTVTKSSYASGGFREGKKGSASSGITYSPPPKEKKSVTTMAAALSDVFDGSSQIKFSTVCSFNTKQVFIWSFLCFRKLRFFPGVQQEEVWYVNFLSMIILSGITDLSYTWQKYNWSWFDFVGSSTATITSATRGRSQSRGALMTFKLRLYSHIFAINFK